ncbi:NAD(+) hydrolase sarm1 isoform X7 [Folsomia candida]|uniref:NAD(+) hydrolase sarm1 isoform X7 n=1 Tax=Folsomia candida TaxID=158441 RepID=UPI000B8FF750|nr:NAD(+) hydrolase sarm1 isoform X7 [Folsomia candida]
METWDEHNFELGAKLSLQNLRIMNNKYDNWIPSSPTDLFAKRSALPTLTEMADTEELGSQTALNGQNMGLLNGVQSTGNVQVHSTSKAAAFQRINSSQSHAQQTVNSSRRMVSSSLSSHHQTNETSQHVSKQSSTQHVKSNLSEMQTRMSQMKALSSHTSSSESQSSSTSSSIKSGLSPLKLITDSKSKHLNGGDTPLDTGVVLVTEVPFPSPTDMQLAPHLGEMTSMSNTPLESPNLVMNNHPNSSTVGPDGTQSFRFEQKKVASSSSTKVRSGNFSAEQSSANAAEVKRVQTGDVNYEEKQSAQAMRQKVEMDGVTAEKSAALKKQQRSLTQGGVTEEETRTAAAAAMKLSTDTFTAEKRAVAAEQRKQTLLAGEGTVINSEKRVTAASQSRLTFKNQLALPSSFENELIFEDLDSLGWESSNTDVNKVTSKYSEELEGIVDQLLTSEEEANNSVNHLNYASGVMKAAWSVPGHGNQVGVDLCDTFRKAGGLDLVISNFNSNQKDLRVASAKLLEASLTPDNCNYVVEKGFDCLDKVVKVASELCEVEESRVGTGLLRHLFRHSEETCSDVLRLHGLERVISESRRMDVETLRNCAAALVNLSLYGGAENQEAMIKKKVHIWLFPLAFHQDDVIKYNACLAIAVLLANKEIEAQIIKSNTLQLVEPFLMHHNPEEFAQTSLGGQGQIAQWLMRLVPVLSSQREEACSIAAFHFCMEAGIKKREGTTHIFKQINVIEPLKRAASSPNALASKFAAQALRIIGETVPHKLSQQVPLWSIEDVREWVTQKGFDKNADSFMTSRVDGDLLLQLTEDMLKTDIGMENGILRKRFMRDLKHLKKMTDYSSCDSSLLNDLLNNIHPDFCAYTYTLINNHVDKDTLRKCISEEALEECGITNSIHRRRIMEAIKAEANESQTSEDNPDKPLDVFISYRRSNGSQLASLLKVHLQLRGFSVFIDVERLEAGKFDNNLLQSIRQARHFLLVLTPNALDRCVQDNDCKDWVHREIVAALDSQCNIIPIMDNFLWPETENLPEDIQPVLTFNGVKWIHDYQEACVDKLERFLRGESVTDPIINAARDRDRDREQQSSGSSSSTTRPSQQYQRTLSVGSEGTRTES